jgi:adenylosuccinate synthase
MKVDVLLGLQWGDEGKGKIVDVLAPQYDIIARFQGGPNAGHTLEFNNNKVILHTIPSGIFHEEKLNIIGNGVVIDPVIFAQELNLVETLHQGARKNLCISKRAHLILPTHRLLDAAQEKDRGASKIGSTLKGISPAYTDKYSRNGLRVGDLLKPDFMQRYEALCKTHMRIVEMLGCSAKDFTIDGKSFSDFEKQWKEDIRLLAGLCLIDTEMMLAEKLAQGKRVLAEGAQGTLLDIDFGSYPFVTSSHTVCGGVCTGLGIAPSRVGKVYGIFKAYCTRVGSGPFPTELKDETGEKMRKQGFEFGSTTGRPRRCGWLDLAALRYSIMLNGVTDLIMTKADVLDNFETIHTCDAYRIGGREYSYPPYEICDADIAPVLTAMKGWQQAISRMTDKRELPGALSDYIRQIEKISGTPVSMVSTGPDRKQIIMM